MNWIVAQMGEGMGGMTSGFSLIWILVVVVLVLLVVLLVKVIRK